MRPRTFALFAALALAAPLSGQSLLSSSGLGLRIDAVDARVRMLGGVGIGTAVPGLLPGLPTAALDLLAPSLAFTTQSSWGDFTFGDQEGDFRGQRFPTLGVSFPVGLRSVITFTAGTVFDQRWSLTRTGTETIGENVFPTTDRFDSSGGVSEAQLGFARWIRPGLAVGVSAGLYRGQTTRTFTRQFDTISVSDPIAPFISGGKWTYYGPQASVEAIWDPLRILRIAGRLGWSGTLDADPTDDTEGAERSIDLPMEYGLGATLQLTNRLFVNGALETSSWVDLDDEGLDAAAAGRATTMGVGLEWAATSFWAGAFPLRLGYRRAQLPFLFDGDQPLEQSLSFGFQVVMSQAQGLPLTTLDIGGEFGTRSSDTLDENYRRIFVTFRLSGR